MNQNNDTTVTTEQVRFFAHHYLKSILTDCTNVRVHCVSAYLHLPIHMWHIWVKYTYKGQAFDISIEIWQNGKELEVCQTTEVWS